jgi:flagellar hook-length control protein FliK
MIAQPVLTTPTQKSQAHQQTQQQSQQPQNAGAGFQSLLSMTDSSLTDLAQNTGASATTTPQPANSNKQKNNDPTGVPYVPAPNQPVQDNAQPSPSDGKQAEAAASDAINNVLTPATDPTATAASAPAATAAAANDQSNGTNPNSSAFGADALNARIASGAPIYASQPGSSMATVPAHLLDATANTHALPGDAATLGKPADTSATKAPAADANAVMTPSSSSTSTPTSTLLASHQAVTAVGASSDSDKSDDDSATKSADAATTATTNDPLTPSASMLTQPSAPQTAPAQADAAMHTPAPYVPVGEQVAINLKQALNADNNEIRIQLKPAALGTIDVKLNVGSDGRINAVISADRADTLNMLKQDSGTLQQALKDAGLNADSSSLSFNLNSNAQSFAQNWSQGGGSGGGSGANSPYGGNNAGDTLAGNDTPAPVQRSHSGALNIEV